MKRFRLISGLVLGSLIGLGASKLVAVPKTLAQPPRCVTSATCPPDRPVCVLGECEDPNDP